MFALSVDSEDAMQNYLQPYTPFLHEQNRNAEVVFSFDVVKDGDATVDLQRHEKVADFDENGQRMQLYRSDAGAYVILMTLVTEPSGRCILCINKDFSSATYVTSCSESMRVYGMNSGLMMMFAFAGATHHLLLIHSSVIRKSDVGYLFLGKSGTGKSTHSTLWLKYIPGTDLLNDDNPALRLGDDGIPMVYGTPWSGKTPCYRNIKARIGGFVDLHQAPHNKIKRLSAIEAYVSLLPAVSNMKWERRLCDGINSTLNAIIQSVPVYSLDCLPDEAAAQMSFRSLTGVE